MSSPANRFFTSSTKSTSAPTSGLSDLFADMGTGATTPSSSPSVSGKLFSGGGPSPPMSEAGCTFGASFVCVSRVDAICGGYIGSGARFCCKSISECKVGSHERKKYTDIKAGIYLKGQGEDAFTSPFTSRSSLGLDAFNYLMGLELDSQRNTLGNLFYTPSHEELPEALF